MYASIRRYRSPAPDQLRRRIEDGFVPLLRRRPGFVSYHLVNDGRGLMVAITEFETREGAEEGSRMAAEWVADNAAPLVVGRPDVTAGEVVVRA